MTLPGLRARLRRLEAAGDPLHCGCGQSTVIDTIAAAVAGLRGDVAPTCCAHCHGPLPGIPFDFVRRATCMTLTPTSSL